MKAKIINLKDKKKKDEILAILEESKQNNQTRFDIDLSRGEVNEVDELEELLNKSFDDPDEKYDLFYHGIDKVLRKYLPKGKDFELARRYIYDEKLIFLNKGKIRQKNGVRYSDSRMSKNPQLVEIVNLIAKWAITSQDPSALYLMFYELNEKYGYPHQIYDDTSKYVHKELIKNIEQNK